MPHKRSKTFMKKYLTNGINKCSLNPTHKIQYDTFTSNENDYLDTSSFQPFRENDSYTINLYDFIKYIVNNKINNHLLIKNVYIKIFNPSEINFEILNEYIDYCVIKYNYIKFNIHTNNSCKFNICISRDQIKKYNHILFNALNTLTNIPITIVNIDLINNSSKYYCTSVTSSVPWPNPSKSPNVDFLYCTNENNNSLYINLAEQSDTLNLSLFGKSINKLVLAESNNRNTYINSHIIGDLPNLETIMLCNQFVNVYDFLKTITGLTRLKLFTIKCTDDIFDYIMTNDKLLHLELEYCSSQQFKYLLENHQSIRKLSIYDPNMKDVVIDRIMDNFVKIYVSSTNTLYIDIQNIITIIKSKCLSANIQNNIRVDDIIKCITMYGYSLPLAQLIYHQNYLHTFDKYCNSTFNKHKTLYGILDRDCPLIQKYYID